jgi:hypothetical protein
MRDLPVFEQVSNQVGSSGLNNCIRRFRSVYTGPESYCDEALRLQFTALGIPRAARPAEVNLVSDDDSDGVIESKYDNEASSSEKGVDGGVYEPLSPSYPASSQLDSLPCVAPSDSRATMDESVLSTPGKEAEMERLVLTPEVVKKVAAAITARRRRKIAAKRLRRARDRRLWWKRQGGRLYRGAATLVCGYGLIHALATACPDRVAQAITIAHHHVGAIAASWQ